MATSLTLSPILAIPGLYISDRFAARSKPLLAEHGITHVLSLMRWEDLPPSTSTSTSTSTSEADTEADTEALLANTTSTRHITRKQVDIDDDPTEDILGPLGEMLDFIHDALSRPDVTDADAVTGPSTRGEGEKTHRDTGTYAAGRVLVHCNQGISRSGAVVVAYIMKCRSLPYNDALRLARQSRSLITPNIGFEYQLRIWKGCGYAVLQVEADGDTKAEVGQGNRISADSRLKMKPKLAYEVWREEVARIYNHAQYREVQRAKEDLLRSLMARLENLRGE
ncbi:dual specificity protein phosphatase family protein [Aspergillus lucknowensis]|uniref:protein-tyrosine-phosphatase n=1 Tax=Aspergillus lucknowensis TaxID=176173 RepID=A0ABR4LUI6_9EURO